MINRDFNCIRDLSDQDSRVGKGKVRIKESDQESGAGIEFSASVAFSKGWEFGGGNSRSTL